MQRLVRRVPVREHFRRGADGTKHKVRRHFRRLARFAAERPVTFAAMTASSVGVPLLAVSGGRPISERDVRKLREELAPGRDIIFMEGGLGTYLLSGGAGAAPAGRFSKHELWRKYMARKDKRFATADIILLADKAKKSYVTAHELGHLKVHHTKSRKPHILLAKLGQVPGYRPILIGVPWAHPGVMTDRKKGALYGAAWAPVILS